MDIKIEELQAKHISEVTKIEKLCFSSPWSQQAFIYEILYNEFAYYFVAIENGEVVGYGGMWIVLDEAHITNIAVCPRHRGKKIGYLIMQQLIAQAVDLGAVKMTLEVRTSNVVARRLYKKLGFREQGVRRSYYNDNNEDAIIMWKYDLTKKPVKNE